MIIGTVDKLLTNNGIKCVVYGASGIGKTRAVLTAPRPLYISAENGGLSLRGNNVPSPPEINTLAQLMEVHAWITSSKEANNYDTICIDSISEIAEVVLRAAKTQTKDGRKAHDDAAELIINLIFRSWRNLPNKHVYMIAKERGDTDAITSITQFKPAMPNRKLLSELPYFFDFVFRYVQLVNPTTQQRWTGFQCSADATAVAKDRSGTLQMWEPPHLGNLFTKAMTRT